MEILNARGLRITTSEGDLLDAISGTFNLPLGFNHPEVECEVQWATGRMSFVPSDLRYGLLDSLEAKLLDIGKLLGCNKVKLRDLCGSTAMEFAIKLAQRQTGRSSIMSFAKSHHGQTISTISVSGSSSFRGEKLPWVAKLQKDVDIVPLDASYDELRERLRVGKFAAVIIEPVLGNGGNLPHAPEKFRWLRELCTNYGTLLIVDEVQTGFGRTGQLLACDTFGIIPDIVVLGKGLGNGYPIAAVLYNDLMGDLKGYQHSFTTGAHPVGVAAAWTTIRVLQKRVLSQVHELSQYLQEGLRKFMAEHNYYVTNCTGVGMMWGLHLPSDAGGVAVTNAIVKAAREQSGLRVRSSQDGFGHVVKIRPALIASKDEIDEIFQRLHHAFQFVRDN